MKEPELSTIFPEINDPEWIKDREECWALALEKGDWKSEYRKKDLEKIRQYFFYGKYPEGLDITKYSGVMLDLFPIQTKAGYDYYYKTHEFTPEQLESNFRSAFLTQYSSGMRWQEQTEYFLYHVGDKFTEKKTYYVKGEEVSIDIDPVIEFKNMTGITSQTLRYDHFLVINKSLLMNQYFKSIIEYINEKNIAFEKVSSRSLIKLIPKVLEGKYDGNEEYASIRNKMCENLKPQFLKWN